MLKASSGKMLATTVTGSLPRPNWYTENLGLKSFLDAMVISRFREQYVDALSVYLREQEVAGMDIVTDRDCRVGAPRLAPAEDCALPRWHRGW